MIEVVRYPERIGVREEQSSRRIKERCNEKNRYSVYRNDLENGPLYLFFETEKEGRKNDRDYKKW